MLKNAYIYECMYFKIFPSIITLIISFIELNTFYQIHNLQQLNIQVNRTLCVILNNTLLKNFAFKNYRAEIFRFDVSEVIGNILKQVSFTELFK